MRARKLAASCAVLAALLSCQVPAAYAANDVGSEEQSAIEVEAGAGALAVEADKAQAPNAVDTGKKDQVLEPANAQPTRYQVGWNLIDGNWYYAVSKTKLKSGWLYDSGAWYWLDPSSFRMATGVVKVGGSSYHLSPSGAMTTGWAYDAGSWYWSNASGALKSGWLYVGGAWYWLDPSSFRMATGWVNNGGSWYFMASSGAMFANAWILDGNGLWHWANSSGAMQSGWVWYGNRWYYLDPKDSKHAAVTGLKDVGGKQYFFDSDGAMAANRWVTTNKAAGDVGFANGNGEIVAHAKSVKGQVVLTNGDGKIASGWVYLGGRWFYAAPGSGVIAKGWVKVSGTWYYFDNQGAMVTGWANVDGGWYYLQSSGAMLTGWLHEGSSWYYLDSSNGGRMVSSCWKYVGSVDYKFNKSGRMVGAWVDVPAMNQYPELPDGCESVALANMLRYYGFPVGKMTIWNSYLNFSGWDFVTGYAMGGCMAPAICNAANGYLHSRGSSHWAQDVTGSSRSDIYWYLQYGMPVQVWGTVGNGGAGYAKASQWYGGRWYNFYTSNHSIVVQGYDEERGVVYIADSISGNVTRNANSFFNNYWTTGSQAVVIR